MNKKKTIMISTIALSLLILVIGVSFAYYNAKVNENNKTQTVIRTKELELVFTGKNEITADNMIAGDSFKKTFTVENKSNEEIAYNIYMQNIYSEFDKYLVYKLEDEDGEVIPFSNVPGTDVKSYLASEIKIGAKETKEYTLTIMFEYVEENQIAYAGKEFRATVGIDTKNLTGIIIHNEKISVQEVTTSITHKFKVENYDNFASQYDISLEDIINDYGENLTYSLIKNGEEIISDEKMPTEDTLILENVLIAANTVDYYEMKVVYNSKVAKLLKNDIELLSTNQGFGAIITTKKDKNAEDAEAPVYVNSVVTSSEINAEYTEGSAKTGISSYACYLTQKDGSVISEGEVTEKGCYFSGLEGDTTYNFTKCIISNYKDKECDDISSVTTETSDIVVAPVLSSKSSASNSVTAVYDAGSATSGIKSTTCYRVDSSGNILSNGTLSGNNCVFSGLSASTKYYFKKCIISNTDIEQCSTIGNATTAGTVKNFGYTGGVQSYVTPCAGTFTLEVWGAQGAGTNGGKGGYSKGTKTLSKGVTIYVYVGGAGSGATGGYNGGGTAAGAGGYGGGGATHMATVARGVLSNYASYKSNLYIVAGGGGGTGPSYQYGSTTYTPYGGTGGGTSGGAGQTIQESAYHAKGGNGGTQSAGGAAITHASGTYSGTSGSFGQGAGGSSIDQKHGAGGGGYYGGGSGAHYAGGGGGSGYVGGVTSGTMTNGSRSTSGYARITATKCTNY